MIYLLIFIEFLKIGLLAIGGGLVTIPFLFELTEKYDWFTNEDVADFIGMSQSLPGAMGVNMAVFAGNSAAGVWGGLIAGIALVIPPIISIIFLSQFLVKYNNHPVLKSVLVGIRPTVIALILMASLQVAQVSIMDYKSGVIFLATFLCMMFYKKSPIFYIFIGALIGILLKL